MQKTEKKVLFMTLIPLATAFGMGSLGVLSMSQVKGAAVFIVIAGSIYYAQKQQWLRQWHENTQRTGSSAVSDEAAKQAIKDWSKRNYSENNEITFRWDFSDFDTTTVTVDGDTHYVYAFRGLGDNNREVLVFYDATADQMRGSKVVRYSDMRDRPFKYCEFVQQHRRQAKYEYMAQQYRDRRRNRRSPMDSNWDSQDDGGD